MDSRGSRRLDINPANEGRTGEVAPPVAAETAPSRDALRALYQDEIDLIIAKEMNVIEQRIKLDLQKKFDAHVAEVDKEFADRKKRFVTDLESLSKNVESLKASYDVKVKEEIVSLHLVVVESVMSCLTKIIGDASTYQDIVSSNISGVLEKKSTDTNAVIRVSESEFKFLKKCFADAEWIPQIRIDGRLKDGQMILDDGIASHYEIGFVNHLDAIKAGFIKVLHEHHAI